MKAIKLFFIFSLILGAIVAVFYLANPTQSVQTIIIDDASLQQYREQFEKDWETAGDWNEETFKSHCDLINQLKAQNYDVVALNDMNTATAVEVVYERIFKAWSTASCKKQQIDAYMSAVKTIEQAEPAASSNPSVVLIKKVYEVYSKAYAFAHKSFGLTPTFNGNSWNSYSDYAQSIESQKLSILSNDQYKNYLSNITEISSGLASVTSRLASGRTHFYNSLARQIRAYYSNIPRAERKRSDLNRLRNVNSSYASEYNKNSLLDSFVKSFNRDVIDNEDRQREEDASFYGQR